MQLETLTIHNIASIADAEIQFHRPPLSEEPVFLICGPTGAGKSTILDAICLALYNKSPRLENASAEEFADISEKSAKGSRTKQNDVRTLLRRGSGEGWITLSFRDDSGRRFTARWSCRRARGKATGAFQSIEWTLSEGNGDGIEITRLLRETRTKIEEIVGLNFEQFRRTTLLAQGEFSRFLISSAEEKSAILEKLTGTSIYSDISMLIQKEYARRNTEYQQLQSQIEGVRLLSEEERTAIQSELDTIQSELKRIADSEQNVTRIIDSIRQLSSAETLLEQSKKNIAEAENRINSSDYRQLCVDLELWDNSEDLRRAMLRLKQLSDEKQHLKDRSSNSSRFAQCKGSVETIRHQHNASEKVLQQLTAEITRHSEYAAIYSQSGALEADCRRLSDYSRRNDQLTENIRLRTENRAKYDAQIIIINERLQEISQKLLKLRNDHKLLQDQLTALNPESLSERYTEAADRLIALQRAASLFESYRTALARKNESENDVREITAKLTLAATIRDQLKLKLEEQLKDINDLTAVYERQRESTCDFLNELRSNLKEGDRCPLCGQMIDSLTSTESFQSLLRPIRSHLDQLKSSYDTTQKSFSAISAEYTGLKSALNGASKRLQQSDRQVAKSLAEVNADPTATRIHAEAIEADDLNSRIGEATALKRRLEKDVKEMNTLRSKSDRLTTAITAIDLDRQKNESELQRLKAEQTACISELENLNQQFRENLTETTTLNESILKTLKNHVWTDGISSPAEAVKRMINDAGVYRVLQEKHLPAAAALNSSAARITLIEEKIRSVINLRPEWENIEARKSESDNIETLLDNIIIDIRSCNERLTAITSEEATLNSIITEWDRQFGIEARKRIAEIDALPTKTTDLRQRRSILDEAIISAHAALKGAIENHSKRMTEAAGHTSAELETLSASKAALIAERESRLERRGHLTGELHRDEEARRENESKLKELEQVKGILDRWYRLNTLFGSADGKKLRTIAQSFILEHLIRKANQYLRRMSSRYELGCQPGSLTLLICDKDAGRDMRPAVNLSGGESFVVSLALALGLSGIGGRIAALDTIFIDEGFGSLDANVRSIVVDTLEHLHRAGGCRVGLISHVESLRERINVQLRVDPITPTSSRIRILNSFADK